MTLPVTSRLGIGYLGTTAIAVGAGATTDGTLRVALATDSAMPLPSGGATAAKQDTIIGHVGGIETALTTLLGYVDGVEGFTDGLEGLATALNGYVDGLESLGSGAATSAKQDTGNASLASIDGKITACNTGAVVISSSELPSGAATAANQTTEIAGLASIDGHVDGIEASLSSIDGKITAVNTGAVVISSALPAGTNAIGKLAANTGVIIGAVEIAAGQTVAVTNAGTFAAQVDGAALTSLQLIDDVIYTDDAAFTPGTSKIAGIGLQADETGTDSVDEGDVGCPRMTLDRKTITSPQPHTAGGCSAAAFLSDGATKAGVIKNAAGQIYGLSVGNANAAACYVRLYNMTTNPATTDTPVYRFLIPGGSAGAGREKTWPLGMAFSTGIAYRITTGAADNNDTAAASAEVTANFDYK